MPELLPSPPGQTQSPNTHSYLGFCPGDILESPYRHRLAKDFALVLANYYSGKERTRSQWAKVFSVTCEWYKLINDGKGKLIPGKKTQSKPFSLKGLEHHLATEQKFNSSHFDLPEPFCDWLDGSITFSPTSHMPGSIPAEKGRALTLATGPVFGESFPLRPALDREGLVISSFQLSLIQRIGKLRAQLVKNSNAFDLGDWFEDLRSLIGSAISLVDTTLHQLYFKAQFTPSPGWTFERDKLGERHGRSLSDKLKWVKAITGNWLQLQGLEASLTEVKDVRNHLQHLDPPLFCYSLEDACRWINECIDVVEATWEIRRCAGVLPSGDLIELLLSPRVEFVPKNPGRPRLPQPKHSGYGSVCKERLEGGIPPHRFGDETVILTPIPREPVFAARQETQRIFTKAT